jgi:Uracil DNA glycosylase superfamily
MIAEGLKGSAFTTCTRCALSNGRKHAPIPGTSPCPMDQVKLVVVSAYPGSEEVKKMESISPSGNNKTVNAGKILQASLSRLDVGVGYDLYAVTYRTNAMKCPPKGNKGDRLNTPRAICRSWLMSELSEVPPNTPILLAGSDALQSLLPGRTLFDSRNEVHYIEGHPTIVTVNPIEVERYARFTLSTTGDVVGTPPIPNSVGWLWSNDMKLLASLLKERST